jgi:hypothetical protein
MPIPVPTNSVAISVIDGKKGTKGFLAEVPRIIKSPVPVQGGDRGHFGLVQLKIK